MLHMTSYLIDDVAYIACLFSSTEITEAGCIRKIKADLSRDMRFPTMWYVRPAKPQISLRIRAV